MSAHLGVIASHRSVSAAAPLVLSELIRVYDPNDSTTYNTASAIAPTGDSHIWVCYISRHASAAPRMIPVNNYGSTWTELGGGPQVDGLTTIGCWELQCSFFPGSSPLVLNTASGTAIGCGISVIQATGHNLSGTTVQFVYGPTGVGTAGFSGLVTLASAGAAGNGEVCFMAHRANENHVAEAGWSSGITAAGASPNTSCMSTWKVGSFDTSATQSWATSARYQGLAFEVKAA